MYGLGTRGFSSGDYVWNAEIGLGGRRRANADGLVSELHGEGVLIGLRVHDHDFHTKLVRSA